MTQGHGRSWFSNRIGVGVEQGWPGSKDEDGWDLIPDPRAFVMAIEPWGLEGVLMDLERQKFAIRAIGFERGGKVLIIHLLRTDVSQYPRPYVNKKLQEALDYLDSMCPDGPHSQK